MPTIKHRRATKSQWEVRNPVLAASEIGYEIGTNKLKIGDGLHAWLELPYFIDETVLTTGRLSEEALNSKYARVVVSDVAPTNPPVGTIWLGPYEDHEVPTPQPSVLDNIPDLRSRWQVDKLMGADGAAIGSFEPTAGSWTTALFAPAGTEPTLKLAAFGGRKALSFNGVNQSLDLNHPNIDGPSTMVWVGNLQTTGANGGRAVSSMKSASYRVLRLLSSDTQGGMLTSGTTPNSIVENWTPSSGVRVIVAVFDGATSRFYFHKKTALTGATNLGSQTDLRLGRGPDDSTQYSRVDIADLAIIERAVTDVEAKSILDELAELYGLGLGA